MKLFYTLITLLVVATVAQAQSFMNGSFEEWEPYLGNIENPKYWMAPTNSAAFVFGGPASVSKITDKVDGSYAVLLKTQAYTSSFTTEKDTFTAVLSQIVKITSRPTSVSFYYKSTLVGGDKASVAVVVGNTEDDAHGGGFLTITATTNTYTKATIPITYTNNNTNSDTLYLLAVTEDNDEGILHPGTSLALDKIEVSYSVTGIENNATSSVNVFPNPAKNILSFAGLSGNGTISLMDARGAAMVQTNYSTPEATLSLNSLQPGLYTYKIFSNTSESITHGKVVVTE